MKHEILNKAIELIFNHLPHIISALSYSFLEYKIGKSKKIPENSLWEIIINRLWGKNE